MKSALILGLVGAACAAPHPFQVQQHDLNLQRSMWYKDRYGVSSSAELGIGPPPRFFTQYQDHFDGSNSNTWQQEYFVNATYYKPGGPVFLCVGGEGPPLDGSVVVSSVHCNNAVEFLEEAGAIMFAVQHRYYGCFNASACPVANPEAQGGLRFLSSRQALGDLARFRAYAADKYNTTGKWVSFGGSYPGMLAGWFRLKFPHLVHASIASSAPVQARVDMRGYEDVTAFAYSVSDNRVGGSPACEANIRDGHAQIKALFGTVAGRNELSSLFGETPDFYANYDNQASFAGNGVAQFPSQSNDPNCKSPACNIAKICVIMTNNATGDNVHKLAALVKAQSTWATKKWQVKAMPNEADYWGYQTCAEFAFYQTCEVGSRCFYAQGYVTVASMTEFCKGWGIELPLIQRNVDYSNDYYGGNQPAGECVLYPNGEVDPWKSLSVLKSPSKGIPTLMVPGASHHAWTHPSQPDDQKSVIAARQTIRNYVKQFLGEECNQSQL
eukprot:Rhum_TRINITY_DN3565_c0_g1::Rhum_TRINITY_DN3565_c0_g1_i1::g.11297::m.11297